VGGYVYGAPSPGNYRAGTWAIKPDAVMNAGSNNVYSYDCNGNMTGRTIGGVVYTLTNDAENRLTGISGGGVTASYTYDADGNLVQAVIGSITTVYVGAIYEQTTSGGNITITKYYLAGGQLIALRVNDAVRWLATDHPSAGDLQSPLRAGLGSTAGGPLPRIGTKRTCNSCQFVKFVGDSGVRWQQDQGVHQALGLLSAESQEQATMPPA